MSWGTTEVYASVPCCRTTALSRAAALPFTGHAARPWEMTAWGGHSVVAVQGLCVHVQAEGQVKRVSRPAVGVACGRAAGTWR